ncbi:MAG: hypothetical protein MHM6MM_007125 [Cercozoa sp. M6MM]
MLSKRALAQARHFAALPKVSNVGGFRVLTIDDGGAAAEVGVHLLAGSRIDEECEGRSHLMAKLALATGDIQADSLPGLGHNIGEATQSQLLQLNKLGVFSENIRANATRNTVSISTKVIRHWAGDAVQPLFRALLNKGYYTAEMNHLLQKYKGEREQLLKNDPVFTINDLALSAAFGGKGLGKPLYASDDLLATLDQQTMRDFGYHYAHRDRIVIAGVNVDHQALVAAVENDLADWRRDEQCAKEDVEAEFTGSYVVGEGLPSVSVGFAAASYSDDGAAMSVLTKVMQQACEQIAAANPEIVYAGVLREASSQRGVVGISVVTKENATQTPSEILGNIYGVVAQQVKQADALLLAQQLVIGETRLTHAENGMQPTPTPVLSDCTYSRGCGLRCCAARVRRRRAAVAR